MGLAERVISEASEREDDSRTMDEIADQEPGVELLADGTVNIELAFPVKETDGRELKNISMRRQRVGDQRKALEKHNDNILAAGYMMLMSRLGLPQKLFDQIDAEDAELIQEVFNATMGKRRAT